MSSNPRRPTLTVDHGMLQDAAIMVLNALRTMLKEAYAEAEIAPYWPSYDIPSRMPANYAHQLLLMNAVFADAFRPTETETPEASQTQPEAQTNPAGTDQNMASRINLQSGGHMTLNDQPQPSTSRGLQNVDFGQPNRAPVTLQPRMVGNLAQPQRAVQPTGVQRRVQAERSNRLSNNRNVFVRAASLRLNGRDHAFPSSNSVRVPVVRWREELNTRRCSIQLDRDHIFYYVVDIIKSVYDKAIERGFFPVAPCMNNPILRPSGVNTIPGEMYLCRECALAIQHRLSFPLAAFSTYLRLRANIPAPTCSVNRMVPVAPPNMYRPYNPTAPPLYMIPHFRGIPLHEPKAEIVKPLNLSKKPDEPGPSNQM